MLNNSTYQINSYCSQLILENCAMFGDRIYNSDQNGHCQKWQYGKSSGNADKNAGDTI